MNRFLRNVKADRALQFGSATQETAVGPRMFQKYDDMGAIVFGFLTFLTH